ncbi:oligosaccharide flippase family protein [Leptolyngbya ohadii]|uniref:oligosaccharide flippase family protein n=1 Tax=Leptolyngbya ohadii TaxID=1962290 RepID=UPI000B59B303|nr:oligosaccharide flippase family protein [Leptolyngbya ohadii]
MISVLKQWLDRVGSVKWALADQIVVSALNFITGILLARFLGIEAYGSFVLSYSALLYANTLQQALIIAPMLSIAPQLSGFDQSKYLRGMLSSQIALSTVLCTLIFIAANTVSYFVHSESFSSSLPLSLSILFFQLQDWLRRYYFVTRKSADAFINDLTSYGGQVLVLIILFNTNTLGTNSAFWAIAATSAFAFITGIFFESLYPLRQQVLKTFQKNWKSGFNLFLAGQINWLGSQGILVLSGLILGPQALGGLRAAQNITGPFNILFQGMENFVPIKASQRYAQSQLRGLSQFLFNFSLLGGIAIIIPCILISIFSRNLMVLAYGSEYLEYSYLVIWQLVISLLVFLCFQAFYFFRTINETHQIVFGSIISSSISVISTLILGPIVGVTGVMIATLFGQFGYIIYFTFVILRYLRNAGVKIM